MNLTTNRKTSSIKFRDGSLVPRQRHATYLGTILTDTASNTAEIQNRLAKAIKTCAQLELFWDKAHTSIAWKLRVFNSIVISKLMYGLETIQHWIRSNEMHSSNSQTPPTFIDRTQTNQIVRDRAKSYNVDVTEISVVWKKQKTQAVGHILRRDHADPLRQVLFGYRTFARRIFQPKE